MGMTKSLQMDRWNVSFLTSDMPLEFSTFKYFFGVKCSGVANKKIKKLWQRRTTMKWSTTLCCWKWCLMLAHCLCVCAQSFLSIETALHIKAFVSAVWWLHQSSSCNALSVTMKQIITGAVASFLFFEFLPQSTRWGESPFTGLLSS